MSIQEIGLIIGLSVTSVGALFTVYDRFANTDISSAQKVALLEQGCSLKHNALDKMLDEKLGTMNEHIGQLSKTMMLLQENDIKHIELRLTDQDKSLAKLFTILEERLPRQNT